MEVEWDEAKRLANLSKHGFDLASGSEMLDGRLLHTVASPRGGEMRFVSVGSLGGQTLTLVWTARGTCIRLISLRKARDAEKREYRQRHSV